MLKRAFDVLFAAAVLLLLSPVAHHGPQKVGTGEFAAGKIGQFIAETGITAIAFGQDCFAGWVRLVEQ